MKYHYILNFSICERTLSLFYIYDIAWSIVQNRFQAGSSICQAKTTQQEQEKDDNNTSTYNTF